MNSTSGSADTFKIYCDFNTKPLPFDSIESLTLESCLQSCADYFNRGYACSGVAFGANLTLEIAAQGANCFLKSGLGVDDLVQTAEDTLVSALLVD